MLLLVPGLRKAELLGSKVTLPLGTFVRACGLLRVISGRCACAAAQGPVSAVPICLELGLHDPARRPFADDLEQGFGKDARLDRAEGAGFAEPTYGDCPLLRRAAGWVCERFIRLRRQIYQLTSWEQWIEFAVQVSAAIFDIKWSVVFGISLF